MLLAADRRAFIMEAWQGDQLVGGAFVGTDDATAYLLHSWFERGRTRGIPTLLALIVHENW